MNVDRVVLLVGARLPFIVTENEEQEERGMRRIEQKERDAGEGSG